MCYDMHTHSTFSTDSEMSMIDAVNQAIAIGLTGIAFTDHLDVDYVNYPNDFHYDFNDYFQHVETIIDNQKNKIDIIKAVEVGLQPHVINETISRTRGFNFDYKIGSTHIINRKDPYEYGYFSENVVKRDSYIEYLEEIIKNINLYYDYDALGHFDYLVRYAPFKDSIMYYKDFSDYFDEILKFIINKNIALEINTGTYRTVPLDKNILIRYKDLGGELITIGSDAHATTKIGCLFKEYVNIIKECGFNNLYYYKNRQPIGYKI